MRVLLIVLVLNASAIAEIKFGTLPDRGAKDEVPGAVPTPAKEVDRILGLLPRPEVAFVDFGCGSDARWCIAAAKKWRCKAIGVEIDHDRAEAAKRAVRDAGMTDTVSIIEGDATTTNVAADVGVAYLFPDVLTALKPKIQGLRAFASFIHEPQGLQAVKNGDAWIVKPVRAAVWNGQTYSGPVCNNPNCGMCNSIRAQLASPQVEGHYETQKVRVCNGRFCWYEDRQVWIPGSGNIESKSK